MCRNYGPSLGLVHTQDLFILDVHYFSHRTMEMLCRWTAAKCLVEPLAILLDILTGLERGQAPASVSLGQAKPFRGIAAFFFIAIVRWQIELGPRC